MMAQFDAGTRRCSHESQLNQALIDVRAQNRWIKVFCLLLALGLLVSLLLHVKVSSNVNKVITAERFVLQDANGMERAALGVADDRAGLIVFDQTGKQGVVLGTHGQDAVLAFRDQRETRLTLGIKKGSSSLILYDPTGTARAVIAADHNGPIVGLTDEMKHTRIWLSARSDEPLLKLFDEKGATLFSQP